MQKTMCGMCHEYFSSTREFDRHRVGEYGKTPPARRCLTTAEMTGAGWVSQDHPITDETGRPVRRVWFRASVRAKTRESFAGAAAKGIVAGGAASL